MLGVGMAAMRDVVSFFRYADKDAAGTANPIVGQVRHVVAMGNSQSGRFAKAFLNLGFNEDLRGRIVWDGLNARIAGMMGGFNTRFAQPGDIAELYEPGAEGPLWWSDYEDSVRGLPAWGLLHRCTASKTCPKITETYGGPEIWYSRGTRRDRRDDRQGRSAAARTTSAATTMPGRRTAAARAASTLGTPSGEPELTGEQSESRARDRSRAVCRAGRLGGQGDARRRRASTRASATARSCRRRPPRWDGRRFRTRPSPTAWSTRCSTTTTGRVSLQRQLRRHDQRAAADQARDSDAGAEGGRRRQRVAGVKSVLLRVPLGTYTGWNPIASGVAEGPRAIARGRLHPVREDEGRAAGERRSAAVDRGALSRPVGVLRCGRRRGRRRPGEAAPAAARRRRPAVEAGAERHGEQQAAACDLRRRAGVAARRPRSQQDGYRERLRCGETRHVDRGQRDRRAGAEVTLAAPRWIAATANAPARCEVDGAMAPVDTAATARPINFRVWLPARGIAAPCSTAAAA